MIIKKDPSRPYKLSISLVITILLAIAVKMRFGFIDFLDTIIVGSVQHGQSGFETKLFTFISFLGSPKMDILWMLVIAFILWGFRYKVPAFFALFLIISGNVVAFLVKHIVARPRPSMHLAKDTGFSFPSGHVVGTFFVISVLWIIVAPMLKKESSVWIMRTALGIWLILVMVSRVYLNAHFPSDVIGGAFFAYTWLQICEYLYVRYAPELSERRVFIRSLY
ncbi:phosphatase [Fructilactobacillus lindneri]|nr:phosphatase PAP2 family protein [Fructilactobacillus lindneri]ANZ57894.1 phosphatase [Fructilactobacillus lindneri]ANZ59163.1 phosphatase [Fructilactobacillus lindneri]POG98213.1 phosphatase [Fructilactobacillus lindneri]POH01670.1 phosphatase [Fructilactobacillus lindneri]POH03513.1 phosphatase [Fructilactobacillus lindneri]